MNTSSIKKLSITGAALLACVLLAAALPITNTAGFTMSVTGVTATAAEVDVLAGVTAGTVTAGKAIVTTTSKHIDALVITDGGLALGAGAGTVVTATAAELNLIDGCVAGTSVASKALCLGANKETDVLALPVSGLKIGAGAGTAVTASAAELNILTGVTATAVEINNAADDSGKTQAIVVPGAITVDGTKNRITVTDAVNGAITLAAPSAAMLGKTLVIEYIGAGTQATTLALTNVQGGSAATTASFNAANETLVLIGGELKWTVLKEVGVTLS